MTTTRTATWADVPALRTVCALAYRDNPLMRWVLPDDATRTDACAAWLGPSLEAYVAGGSVDVVTVDDDVVAVAAWRPPVPDATAPAAPAAPVSLPSAAGTLRALVGAPRAAQVLDALGGARALAPPTPGPYLNYLAVHPGHQSRGLGGGLLRRGLTAWGGTAGTPWLATSDPRNLPFYARHGFGVAGSLQLGDDGPVLTVLHGHPTTTPGPPPSP